MAYFQNNSPGNGSDFPDTDKLRIHSCQLSVLNFQEQTFPDYMRLSNPDQQVSKYLDLETQHLHIKITMHSHFFWVQKFTTIYFRFGFFVAVEETFN